MTISRMMPPLSNAPWSNLMTDIARSIAFAALVLALVWSLFLTAARCHAAGGTTVRGLFWLECIQ
jgi:hypothetical protein